MKGILFTVSTFMKLNYSFCLLIIGNSVRPETTANLDVFKSILSTNLINLPVHTRTLEYTLVGLCNLFIFKFPLRPHIDSI